jgi:hypothetical protein
MFPVPARKHITATRLANTSHSGGNLAGRKLKN